MCQYDLSSEFWNFKIALLKFNGCHINTYDLYTIIVLFSGLQIYLLDAANSVS